MRENGVLENSTLSGNFLHECPKILGRKKKQQKKKKKMQKKTVTMMKKKGKKKEKKKMKEKRKTKNLRFEGASFWSGGASAIGRSAMPRTRANLMTGAHLTG